MPDKSFNADDFEYEQPSEEQLQGYIMEMGTNKEKIGSEVVELKSWLASHPILPAIEDDTFLERFHAHCKYQIEKTKKKLDCYFRARAIAPEIMLNRDPLDPNIQRSKEYMSFASLPLLTNEGYRVTVFKVFNPDTEFFDPEQTLKSSLMMLDGHINEDFCVAHVLIIDGKGFTPQHLIKYSPSYFKKSERCNKKAFPHRYANLHILNVSPYMAATINLLKLTLGSKMASRVISHSNIESLHKYIPKRILPKEYGGTYEMSLEEIRDLSFKFMEKKRDWFLEQKNIFADLKEDPEEFSEIFGSKGTFKKIQID